MKRKIGSTYFNDELVYDGNDLGAVFHSVEIQGLAF